MSSPPMLRTTNGLLIEVRQASELDLESQITARPIADYRTGRVRARFAGDWEFWEHETEL